MLCQKVQKLIFFHTPLKPNPLRKGPNCRFVFIHINKTGGTSIAKSIGMPIKRHLTAKEIIKIIGKNKWEDAYKFAFVRNPWDKAVSHYKYRIKTNQNNLGIQTLDFNQWIKKTHVEKDPLFIGEQKMFLPQIEWLKDNNNKIVVDKIGYFESINEDFEEIAHAIGINIKLPHLNKTKNTDYKSFYNRESVEIIRNFYKEDIETFGYSFK